MGFVKIQVKKVKLKRNRKSLFPRLTSSLHFILLLSLYLVPFARVLDVHASTIRAWPEMFIDEPFLFFHRETIRLTRFHATNNNLITFLAVLIFDRWRTLFLRPKAKASWKNKNANSSLRKCFRFRNSLRVENFSLFWNIDEAKREREREVLSICIICLYSNPIIYNIAFSIHRWKFLLRNKVNINRKTI